MRITYQQLFTNIRSRINIFTNLPHYYSKLYNNYNKPLNTEAIPIKIDRISTNIGSTINIYI